MPNDVIPPFWILWTGVALCAVAVLWPLVGSWRARRRSAPAEPALTVQALSSSTDLLAPPPGSSRTSKTPALLPAPAPLAATLAEGQPEKRALYRRAGNPVLVHVADADTHRRPWNAWVIDRSRRGLRLATDQELTVGEVYTIRPAQAPPATPWSAVEVRHCTEVDGHWEAGCRFVRTPSVPLLMLFG